MAHYYFPPHHPGRIPCLKCRKDFQSKDKVNNRICPDCDRRNKGERVDRVLSTQVHVNGRRVQVHHDAE